MENIITSLVAGAPIIGQLAVILLLIILIRSIRVTLNRLKMLEIKHVAYDYATEKLLGEQYVESRDEKLAQLIAEYEVKYKQGII